MTEIADTFDSGFYKRLSTSGTGWPTRTRTPTFGTLADGLLAGALAVLAVFTPTLRRSAVAQDCMPISTGGRPHGRSSNA